jgi:hypothetical protein
MHDDVTLEEFREGQLCKICYEDYLAAGAIPEVFLEEFFKEPSSREKEENLWTNEPPPNGKKVSRLPTVTVMLERKYPSYALIDSGSTVSMIGKRAFRKVTEHWPKDDHEYRKIDRPIKSIYSASGNTIPTEGVYVISLVFDHVIILHHLTVISDVEGGPFESSFDVILGMDFLKPHGATLFLKEGYLKIGTYELPLHGKSIEQEEEEMSGQCHIIHESEELQLTPFMVKERVTIRSNEICLVQFLKLEQDAEPFKIQNQMMSSANLICLNQWVTGDKEVSLALYNIAPNDTSLEKGQEEWVLHDPDVKLNQDEEWPILAHQITQQAEAINDQQKKRLLSLFEKFKDILRMKTDPPGKALNYSVTVHLESEEPVNLRQYPLTYEDRIEVGRQVNSMVNNGIISPSESPWNFPVIFVNKKIIDNEGNVKPDRRMCVDLRALNERTKKINFPIPTVDFTIQSLHGCQYFSSLDVLSGFWHLDIEESSRKYFAFSTLNNHYQFNVLPFGWVNSPFYFQQYMQTRIANKIPEYVQVYIDDIIIFSKTVEEHFQAIQRVFEIVREEGLRLKLAKCSFFNKEMEYLGHIISARGIQKDPKKLKAIPRRSILGKS